MVVLVSHCCFCDEAVDSRPWHVSSPGHQQCVQDFFTDKEGADAVVRRTRPTAEERLLIEECISALSRSVRPVELRPTGSIGKGTALRDCHDLDVAAVVDSFDPSEPRRAAEMIAKRLRAGGVQVVRVERHLAKARYEARYGTMDVDVVPTGRISLHGLRATVDTFGWRGALAIEDMHVFSKMPAWRKDVVRLLKAWSRLKIRVPGILFELVARSLQDPARDHIRQGFKVALQRIAHGCRHWPDPVRPQDWKTLRLTEQQWEELEDYARLTLDLAGLGSRRLAMEQPGLVRNRAVRASYTSTPEWEGAHKFVAMGTYTEGQNLGKQCVVKWFKHGPVYSDVDFSDDLRTIEEAKRLVARFNEEFRPCKRVYVNEASVWRKEDADWNGHAKLLVEPFITAKYQRFNSNTGFESQGFDLMAALSHFSFHISHGKMVLCDLQGGCYNHCYVITDPVILSSNGRFGATDLGQDGIDHFFSQHVCTAHCKPWWQRPACARRIFEVREGSSMIVQGRIRYGSRRCSLAGVDEQVAPNRASDDGLRRRRQSEQSWPEENRNGQARQQEPNPVGLLLMCLAFLTFLAISSGPFHY